MSVWPGSSSKAVINCGHNCNARFEFGNVSTVTVSGLEFVGCFENYVISVDQVQLENSGFYGNGQAIVSGTVLSIEESTASLDRVAFTLAVEKLQTSAAPQVPEDCNARMIETMDEVIGILLKRSCISITQSRFEGNKVGLGAVIYDEFGSDITISTTIFINNSATQYYSSNCCFAGGIVYVSSQQGSTVKIYHSKFEKNIGVIILIYGDDMYISSVSIVHSEFVDNTIIGPRTVINGSFQSNSLVTFVGVMVTTMNLSDFINNKASFAVVHIQYCTTAENLAKNVFIDNSVAYDI